MSRVTINPNMFQWACRRAGLAVNDLRIKFPMIEKWIRNEAQPTLKQLERFAKATYTPIGYMFLSQPPQEQMPIPDFRVLAGKKIQRPSPDLLDTVYICQQRQEWYRDFARFNGEKELGFVGYATINDDIVTIANKMRHELKLDIEQRRQMHTWENALREFIEQADALGILVMVNGVVGNNNRRKLNSREFRGFALADKFAPLVFINGADTKAAQMFTLAHEIAHIWLGCSAVSDAQADHMPDNKVERWCNMVAAELLVPFETLRQTYQRRNNVEDEISRLARCFKVSTLVILRRMYDVGGLTKERFQQEYNNELERLLSFPRGSGGNFYLTQAARVSKRFARALVVSTLEGKTLHRDAFRLMGFSKLSTFRDLGYSLGVGQ